MTSQIKIQDEVECDTCGDRAVTEFVGGGGSVHPLCGNCDVHLRETLAGLWDVPEMVSGVCDDCMEVTASRRFLHLDGRAFALCDSCYMCAHHEAGYLAFCECAAPRVGADGAQCSQCELEIRSWGNESEEDRQYDWGEEQEGDFPAEEPEDEEDDDDYEDWRTDDWCADSV